ncbi:MAG: hypothetical protein GAK30_02128 [Paracidovorax wautersii]|uniref:Putative Flp pilus-assembly TadG-like N-terminal domain-containing protein n=1 Tax=Paracidovorax wautersii TaxID=1177982 RepID=A0A7V8FNL1_9BURK|nr:MAG: hypothetical protein GAK30_02128 [Paracidovorax wautersii]
MKNHKSTRGSIGYTQRGGILINAALGLMVCVVVLGVVQVGYSAYVKRELQTAADLAALAGAQELSSSEKNCQRAINVAERGGAANVSLDQVQVDVGCASWKEVTSSSENKKQVDDLRSVGGLFSKTNSEDHNAVLAIVKAMPATLIPGLGGEVFAKAVAKIDDPLVSFSVGSQLLNVNNNKLLGQLLRLVGVNPALLTVLDKNGVVQAQITPSGLLKALGLDISVDELKLLDSQGLAALDVTVGDILAAAIKVIEDKTLQLDLAALRTALISAGVGAIKLPLASSENGNGLLAFIGSDAGSPLGAALDVKLQLGELIKTAIMFGVQGRAVYVPDLTIAGLINVKAGVVEPPSIGVGGVGTTAYNSQIRLYLNVDTNNIPVLGFLLNTLRTRVNIPLIVNAVSGYGVVDKISCESGDEYANVNVVSSIAGVCVGKFSEALIFSTKDICGPSLGSEVLVRLLGQDLINDKINLNALVDTQSVENLKVGFPQSTVPNSLRIGTTVSGIVNELLRVLSNLFSTGMPASDVARELAVTYLTAIPKVSGRYNLDAVINLMKNGKSGAAGEDGVAPMNPSDWIVKGGVPRVCGLGTCWDDGSVWDSFKMVSTGANRGVLDSLVGFLLGGLAIDNCWGLFSGSSTRYNSCIENNLAEYLSTSPSLIAGVNPVGGASCNTVLCTLLRPVLRVLEPILNGVGSLLGGLLNNVLGIELGKTEVNLLDLRCGKPSLVY